MKQQKLPNCLFNSLDVYLLRKLMSYLLPADLVSFSKYYPHNALVNKVSENQQIIKKNPKICEVCMEEDGKIFKIFGMRLCDQCRELPAYTLICKTTAKKQYHLTDKEISGLVTYSVANPHFRSASEMILIKLRDVLEFLCQKYNCDLSQAMVLLANNGQKREQKKQKMAQTREINRNQRKSELVDAMNQYHLVIRSDSKLCEGYIDGTIKNWTLPQIVERMCQMKYLYEHTNFSDEYDSVRKDMYYYGDYPSSEEIFDTAEHNILSKCGGYPKIYPWMKGASPP